MEGDLQYMMMIVFFFVEINCSKYDRKIFADCVFRPFAQLHIII